MKYIRDRRLAGIVYNLDDDNGYHPRLWNELRRLRPRRVGVLAVRRGVFPPPRCDGRFLPLRGREERVLRIERPLYHNATGQFVRFQAGWCQRGWMARRRGKRTFCVDMGGASQEASSARRRGLPPYSLLERALRSRPSVPHGAHRDRTGAAQSRGALVAILPTFPSGLPTGA